MRYVVTGAAGFIGSTLCEKLLNSGHEVVGVDCFTDYYARSIKESNVARARSHTRFNFIEEDLVEANLAPTLRGADAVFHLAAQPGVRTSWGNGFEAYARHGLLATQRVLEACREATPGRLVFASSSSVYGSNARRLPLTEDSTLHPLSPYGITKHACEELCEVYGRSFGVPIVLLRYFTVYGPRQRPDMAFHRFIRRGLTGLPIELYGDGTQSRDFTYVDDAVAATIAAGERGGVARVYNVGGGAQWTVRAVLEALESIIGRSLLIVARGVQTGDVDHTAADTSLARKELDFAPATDVVKGLHRQVEWTEDALRRGLLANPEPITSPPLGAGW